MEEPELLSEVSLVILTLRLFLRVSDSRWRFSLGGLRPRPSAMLFSGSLRLPSFLESLDVLHEGIELRGKRLQTIKYFTILLHPSQTRGELRKGRR